MKYLLILLSAICTSMYLFPFEFVFLKGINTKHMMAAFGTLCFGWDILYLRKIELSKELFVASIIAIFFSIVGFYSTDYNFTSDYAYSTYIGSMWVWFLACYGVCTLMKSTHGYISIRLIIDYLIIVCVFQCIIALCIDFTPSVKSYVDSIFVTGDLEFMKRTKRLYGIGALLDVAGGRFAVVLIMIAFLLSKDENIRIKPFYVFIYILSFLIIGVLGSIISRTTSIGIGVGVLYIILMSDYFSQTMKTMNVKYWATILLTFSFLALVSYFFYYNNDDFYFLLRFAFEGFFNYVETGVWETSSTEILKDMWVFPDNLKTWMIGDGYFVDPINGKFYMGTDVGYLRFIYYSGLIGLSVFCIFFIYLSFILAHRFPYYRDLFYLLLLMLFINWIKVSTDLFLFYAFFLVLRQPVYFNYYKKDFKAL